MVVAFTCTDNNVGEWCLNDLWWANAFDLLHTFQYYGWQVAISGKLIMLDSNKVLKAELWCQLHYYYAVFKLVDSCELVAWPSENY